MTSIDIHLSPPAVGARSAGCRTPPGSPGRPEPDPEKALIQCTVTLRSGARAAAAAAVSRTVDVNFNCLDVVVSPQSWVMVLDFFNGQARSGAMVSRVGWPGI